LSDETDHEAENVEAVRDKRVGHDSPRFSEESMPAEEKQTENTQNYLAEPMNLEAENVEATSVKLKLVSQDSPRLLEKSMPTEETQTEDTQNYSCRLGLG
jgi:hypothetical protein